VFMTLILCRRSDYPDLGVCKNRFYGCNISSGPPGRRLFVRQLQGH
jgi:hypothetical protein